MRRIPRQFAPYHLRLDWLMWFLPLGHSLDDWFSVFLVRLLEADAPTLRMLRVDPFHGERPRWVRAVSYRYRFTTRAEHRADGAIWVGRVAVWCSVRSASAEVADPHEVARIPGEAATSANLRPDATRRDGTRPGEHAPSAAKRPGRGESPVGAFRLAGRRSADLLPVGDDREDVGDHEDPDAPGERDPDVGPDRLPANNAWMELTIEVTGWFSANHCTGAGMVSVGTNAELMNGRKISGYEKALAPSTVLAFRPAMIASQVSARVNSIRMPITSEPGPDARPGAEAHQEPDPEDDREGDRVRREDVSTWAHKTLDRAIGMEWNRSKMPLCISVNSRNAV